MNVGVIGSGAISDIYLKNMIETFDNLEVVALASKNPAHVRAKAEKTVHPKSWPSMCRKC